MTTTTAKCATCNAPITAGMNRCKYCGSDLYFTSKEGMWILTREGNEVEVLKRSMVDIPTFSSQQDGREYSGGGDGGTLTRSSVGSGYIIFQSDMDIDAANNKRRELDRRLARPLYRRMFWMVVVGLIAYAILFIVVNLT